MHFYTRWQNIFSAKVATLFLFRCTSVPPTVLPSLLPELMERLTGGRADATDVTRAEFIEFWELLSSSADL